MKKIITLFSCALIFTLSFSRAQENNDYSERIREEIEVIQKRIAEAEAGQRSIVQQVQDLSQQMELRTKLIRELEKQTKQGNERLKSLNSRINDLDKNAQKLSDQLELQEAELNELRIEAGKRLAVLYRRGGSFQPALFLSARNLNEVFSRRKYIKAIEQYDKVRIQRLSELAQSVRQDRASLKNAQNELLIEKAQRINELERVKKLLAQRRDEEYKLREERKKNNMLYEKIADDKELLMALLADRQRSLEQIEKEINQLEKRYEQAPPDWKPTTSFSKLAGKLPWPVSSRKVTAPYGRVVHPRLGTTTLNPGIDLSATRGESVSSAAGGKVTRISYLRGFGNTIIISHGEGYYTVYSRLGEIMVREGEMIKPGQVIGKVGEVGAEGDFHFEIWANRKTLDPLNWLAR